MKLSKQIGILLETEDFDLTDFIGALVLIQERAIVLETAIEAAEKLAEGVARSPLYHEQKDTYTILRDAMKAWEDNAQ